MTETLVAPVTPLAVAAPKSEVDLMAPAVENLVAMLGM